MQYMILSVEQNVIKTRDMVGENRLLREHFVIPGELTIFITVKKGVSFSGRTRSQTDYTAMIAAQDLGFKTGGMRRMSYGSVSEARLALQSAKGKIIGFFG